MCQAYLQLFQIFPLPSSIPYSHWEPSGADVCLSVIAPQKLNSTPTSLYHAKTLLDLGRFHFCMLDLGKPRGFPQKMQPG